MVITTIEQISKEIIEGNISWKNMKLVLDNDNVQTFTDLVATVESKSEVPRNTDEKKYLDHTALVNMIAWRLEECTELEFQMILVKVLLEFCGRIEPGIV